MKQPELINNRIFLSNQLVRKCILLASIVALTFSTTHAQQTIPATGGNATGSGGSASYSIGQTFYTTTTGTNGSVAQGVQQPYEISVVVSVKEAKGISLACSVYPNPTMDFLTLSIDASTKYLIQSINYQLFDINGKLLETNKATANETKINMTTRTKGTYFLKVSNSNKEVKTFKIIKN